MPRFSSPSIQGSEAQRAVWPIAACLGALYIVWGTTYFAIKVAIEDLPPFFLVGSRLVTAGTVLLAWQGLRGRRMLSMREWATAALIGTLLLVMGNGSVAVAERWVSSGATVALGSILPLATALWSGVFGRWPRRMEWGAIAVGGAGAVIMLMGRDLQASVAGTLIILTGVTSWSFATVLSRRISLPRGATGFGAEMLCAGCIALAVSAALGDRWSLPHAVRVWWAWSYLVVFGSLIGFSCFRYLVERVSPTLASTYAYVNPPIALLIGWRLGRESFSPNLLIGLPVVLVAVGLLAWIHARAEVSAGGAAAAPESEMAVAGPD